MEVEPLKIFEGLAKHDLKIPYRVLITSEKRSVF